MRWLNISNAVTVASIVGGFALVAQLVSKNSASKPTQPYVPRALGTQVVFAVHRHGLREEPLASAGGPTCRYIVVISASCGASADLVRTWSRGTERGPSLPADWRVLWLSASDEESMAGVMPKEFPFPVYYPSGSADVLGKLGVDAVPTHLVLDKTGRIVEGGVGADAPDPARLRPDCSIAPETRRVVNREVRS